MPTDPNTLMRQHLRFTRYLPVQCTVLTPDDTEPRALTGITRNVNAGGLEILLPESLPVNTMVSVRVAGGNPLPGHTVSVDEGMQTPLGIKYPHGVAFEEPVEPSLVRKWVSNAEKRAHPRANTHFPVKYVQAGRTVHGTCLNVSQGGMFIVIERPAAVEAEMMLHFTLPGTADPLAIHASVAWVSWENTEAGAMSGMGVRFLHLTQSQAVTLGTFVDRISTNSNSGSS